MKYRENVCAFSGYRPQKLPFGYDEESEMCRKLKHIILNEITELIDRGYDTFLTGMAQGIDIICAEAVLSLKKEAPGVRLIAVVPCLQQEKGYTTDYAERYRHILSIADGVEYTSNTPYFDGCMWIRNKRLVDESDRLLAVYDGKKGGTHQTVKYAEKINKKVTVIDPFTFHKLELFKDIKQLENQEHLWQQKEDIYSAMDGNSH